MSVQPRTHETLADEQIDDHTSIDLNELVAQTVPVDDDLPDFDVFRSICGATKDTLERTIDAEVDRA
jgi:hypothetical protein